MKRVVVKRYGRINSFLSVNIHASFEGEKQFYQLPPPPPPPPQSRGLLCRQKRKQSRKSSDVDLPLCECQMRWCKAIVSSSQSPHKVHHALQLIFLGLRVRFPLNLLRLILVKARHCTIFTPRSEQPHQRCSS